MEEKEKAVGANAKNAKGDANPNGANPNAKKKDEEKKKKAGVVIGIVGLSVAAAIAAAAGAKGCAPNERSYTVTYLTDDEVQNFQGGSVNVKEGTSIGDLKRQLAPLDGYEVEGFYKDPDCTLEFRDDEKVNDDTKIYIEYKQIEITLIFHNENNPDNNSFDNMTIRYFDKLSEKEMPTPENYSTDEGNYTFKCWKTRDGKVVDLKSMTNGKDLLEIDADGEIDLYAEFEFEKVTIKSYSLNFDKGIKVSRADGSEVTSGDSVKEGEVLTVEGSVDDVWTISVGEVKGLSLTDGNTYTVTGDDSGAVSITSKVEHEYLEFTNSSKVTGLKEGATETDIVIPDNHYDGTKITTIGESAFNGKGLTSVKIGKYIANIGKDAFIDCNELAEVDYAGTIDGWAGIHFVNGKSNPLYFGNQLKIGGKVQENITITVDVLQNTFINCTSIKNVTIGGDCVGISDSAFSGCSELESVTIGDSVEGISDGAFIECHNLTSIVIPSSVEYIGYFVFYNTSLESVYYTGDENTWTEFLSYIDSVSYCDPELTDANTYYFENVDPYDQHPEYKANKYWHYNVEDQKTPEVWAKTKAVLIFDKGIKVSKEDGSEVSSGEGVKIGEVLTIVGSTDGEWTVSVSQVDGATSDGENKYTVTDNITIARNIDHRYLDFTLNGDDYSYSATFKSEVDETNIVIPDMHYDGKSIIALFASANGDFENNITTLTFGKNITTLGTLFAAYFMKLTELNYLGTIDDWASITFNAGSNPLGPNKSILKINNIIQENITVNVPINDSAFTGCKSLKNVTLGEGCTRVGSNAFQICSELQSVIIPNSVTSIGNYAFADCSGLEKIYYKGDEEGWTNLQSSIGTNNTELTNAQIYYFEGGDVNPYKTNPDDTKLYWHYNEGDTTTPVVWTKENQ